MKGAILLQAQRIKHDLAVALQDEFNTHNL